MTVSTTTYKNTYTGDGADLTFDFSFQILDEGDLEVEIINSTGTLQTQTINIDYTVSGAGNTDNETDYTSGTVTFTTAPLSTDTIIIRRDMALTQSVDYIENDNFPAETHEEALDRLTLMIQQQQEQLDRCFKLDYTGSDEADFTLPNPAADEYLKFNSAATALESTSAAPAAGIDDVVDDPSPQLGGNLDVNGNNITSASNGNVTIEPNGTGEIRLNADTVTVEDKIEHAGDTDTYLNFTTNALDFQIGGSSAIDLTSAGIRFGGTGLRISNLLDEDNLASNSDTALATQQSIKAYVDTAALDADDPILEANLDSAGYDIVTTSGNLDIEINPHGSGSIILTTDTGGFVEVTEKIAHNGDTDNLISFTADAQSYETGGSVRLDISNSGVRLGGANARVTTVLDEDAMGSDSATALSTQQSIKAYVDNKSATQAEMETGTSTTDYVSPGVAQYHQSACKAWAVIDSDAATPVIQRDYNIDSMSDSGSGVYTVNIDNDLSDANYAVVSTAEHATVSVDMVVRSRAAGSFGITEYNSATEPEFVHFAVFGDL